MQSLEDLRVVTEESVEVDDDKSYVRYKKSKSSEILTLFSLVQDAKLCHFYLQNYIQTNCSTLSLAKLNWCLHLRKTSKKPSCSIQGTSTRV